MSDDQRESQHENEDRHTDVDQPAARDASQSDAVASDASQRDAGSSHSVSGVGKTVATARQYVPPAPVSDGPKPTLFLALGAVVMALVCGSVARATTGAGARLTRPEAEKPAVVIADQAEVSYCTPQFKEVLQRVLHACGLDGGASRRGCQPSDVKQFASITDSDFNALFMPLKDRGAVLLFDNASHELDQPSKTLLEEKWTDRKGARYFFVVARASKVGSQDRNRALSHRRANSVKFHIEGLSPDPELDKKVGQLWLGNEFAQLPKEFCDWPNSRQGEKCAEEAINRSVFVSWVDCRL